MARRRSLLTDRLEYLQHQLEGRPKTDVGSVLWNLFMVLIEEEQARLGEEDNH